jgi:hypothetical protein
MKRIEDILKELRALIVSRFDRIEKKIDSLINIKQAMGGTRTFACLWKQTVCFP